MIRDLDTSHKYDQASAVILQFQRYRGTAERNQDSPTLTA